MRNVIKATNINDLRAMSFWFGEESLFLAIHSIAAMTRKNPLTRNIPEIKIVRREFWLRRTAIDDLAGSFRYIPRAQRPRKVQSRKYNGRC